MAKNLLVPLLKQIGQVILIDRESTPEELKNAWKADIIWLSIPRDVIPKVLKNIKLQPKQLIIDICSIKRQLHKEIKKTGASHLSLHPMHGPFVPLQGQRWAVIKTQSDILENKNAVLMMKFLKEQNINFLEPCSEDEHDFMIGIVLSIPELLTVVLDSLIKEYTKNSKQTLPDVKKMTEWSVPAFNSLYGFYIHSINSSADWLRSDLILGAHGDLLADAKKAFTNLSKLSVDDIKEKLKEQKKFIENLSARERNRIRSWIERWFVDASQTIFRLDGKKEPKPKIRIQEKSAINEIFPDQKKNITVGIHGISGCFTEESIMRFCEEVSVDTKKLECKYLIEADRVVENVLKGKIDLGVVAVANSGSGVYESTIHALSENKVNVVAIYGMEIFQCLIADSSIKSIDEITEVFGHPQAVSQCKNTFMERFPSIKLTKGKDSDDTALCVKKIADGELPKTTATLASQLAAKKYGLKILEYGMHHDPFNTTTFLIIKKLS